MHSLVKVLRFALAITGVASASTYGFSQEASLSDLKLRDQKVLESHRVRDVYRGPVVFPNFGGRDRAYARLRTRIRNGMKEGPNFAGRMALTEIGCGTNCLIVYSGDVATGRVSNFPLGGEDNPSLKLIYNVRSRAIVAYWGEYEQDCTREVFVWSNMLFNRVEQTQIKSAKVCAAIRAFVL